MDAAGRMLEASWLPSRPLAHQCISLKQPDTPTWSCLFSFPCTCEDETEASAGAYGYTAVGPWLSGTLGPPRAPRPSTICVIRRPCHHLTPPCRCQYCVAQVMASSRSVLLLAMLEA